MKIVLVDGRYKFGIIKETSKAVRVLALEDALITDNNQHLEIMVAGRHYWFCKCCFKRHVQEVQR